jgi:phenylalanyl-tRNA synthetase beta chain
MLGLPDDDLVRISNPMTKGQTALRNTLIPDLLSVVENNLSQGVDGGMVFEWGRTFSQSAGEQETLGGALFGRTGIPLRGKEMVSLSTAKGILEQLFARLGLQDVTVAQDETPPYLHPSQSAWFVHGGERVGFVGALDPSLIDQFAMQVPILVFECSAAKITANTEGAVRYKKPSSFPASKRDLSVSAPRALPEAHIRRVLLSEQAVHSVLLYDLYQGEQIASDRKSLTYELAFRASDRTLTDAEVSSAIARIAKNLEALDVRVRS